VEDRSNAQGSGDPEEGVSTMPLYLDVHNKIDGLTLDMAAEAHKKDLAVQSKYGVNYMRYWYDEGTGKVFCLCTAPSKEAAAAVHREAHGAMADEIIEVKEGS
jgi:Nickel responsive protein SCO4226-like